MWKFVLGGVVGFILGVSLSEANASSIQDIANATYKLYSGDTPICTAVAVAENKLITAAHCDSDNMNIRIQNQNENFELESETIQYLKPIRTFKRKDVMLLEHKGNWTKNSTIVDIATEKEANEHLKFGVETIAVGYPMVKEITLTKGEFGQKVKSPSEDFWDSPLYKTTVPITGGNSGGGFYTKINGEYKLVGLVVGGYRNVSFMNYAIPIENVILATKGFLGTEKSVPETEPVIRGSGIDNDFGGLFD